MYFVGLDLAWGEKNHTGIAVVDSDGRLLHVGIEQDDESIEAAIAPYVSDECLVAIDAPLIVKNPTGYRPCESALNRDFQRFDAGARPAFTDNPLFDPPRGACWRARSASTWTPHRPPVVGPSRCTRTPRPSHCSNSKKTLKYKRGAFEDRQRELLKLMTLIEGLDRATPRLRVNHNVTWVELRKRVAAATRPVQLDSNEDPVDAVICAYVALYRYHRPDDVTVYGDVDDRLHRDTDTSSRSGSGTAPTSGTTTRLRRRPSAARTGSGTNREGTTRADRDP